MTKTKSKYTPKEATFTSNINGIFITTVLNKEKQAAKEILAILNDLNSMQDESLSFEDELKALKSSKSTLFSQLHFNVSCCIFIKSSIDPNLLVNQLINQVKISQFSRFANRIVPFEFITRADLIYLEKISLEIKEKYFKDENTTYAIVVNSRCNNVSSMQVINTIANVISCKVDLTNPELTIVVETFKSTAGIGVLKNYKELKKYNLYELTRMYQQASD